MKKWKSIRLMCLIGAVLLRMDLSGWKVVLAESGYDSSHRLAFSWRKNLLSEGGRGHGDRISKGRK